MERGIIASVAACPFLCSCGDGSSPRTYSSIGAGIRNNSDHVITAHCQALSGGFSTSRSLVSVSEDIPARSERSLSIDYEDVPESSITGPGHDRTFNAFGYRGDHLLVISNSDLIIGDG